MTVVVVGDGAVGLLGVLSAKQMGAGRIIAMSRHASRQKLAREFGATDIVTDRGDAGVARIKELTNGIGAARCWSVSARRSAVEGGPRTRQIPEDHAQGVLCATVERGDLIEEICTSRTTI